MEHFLKTSFIYYSAGSHANILNELCLSFSSRGWPNSSKDKCTVCHVVAFDVEHQGEMFYLAGHFWKVRPRVIHRPATYQGAVDYMILKIPQYEILSFPTPSTSSQPNPAWISFNLLFVENKTEKDLAKSIDPSSESKAGPALQLETLYLLISCVSYLANLGFIEQLVLLHLLFWMPLHMCQPSSFSPSWRPLPRRKQGACDSKDEEVKKKLHIEMWHLLLFSWRPIW